MSAFRSELNHQMRQAVRELAAAERAGDDALAEAMRGRVNDLVEIAGRQGNGE
jgi:hypothetical protein